MANVVSGLVSVGGAPGAALGLYGNLTGADAGYTFFAPRVPNEVVPRVRAFDARGAPLPARPTTREERLREASLALYLVQQDVPRLAAWTIANDAFAHEPRATRASVAFTMHRVPTMAEYRAGARPSDETIYDGEFARSDAP